MQAQTPQNMQRKRYVFSKGESRNPTSILSVPLGIVSGDQVDASTATDTFLLLNLSSETKLSFIYISFIFVPL